MSELLQFKCPRCDTAVTAQPSQAGSRLDCPGCQKSIKVPGVARSSTPKDDLELDLGPVATSPASSAPLPPSSASVTESTDASASSSPGSGVPTDATLPAEPAPAAGQPPANDAAARPSIDPVESSPSPPAADRARSPRDLADEVEISPLVDPMVASSHGDRSHRAPRKRTEETIAVRCDICETRFDAPLSMLGKRVPCPDCTSPIEVVAARRMKPRPRQDVEMDGDDVLGLEPEQRPTHYPSDDFRLDSSGSTDGDEYRLASDLDEESSGSPPPPPSRRRSPSEFNMDLGTEYDGEDIYRLQDTDDPAAPAPSDTLDFGFEESFEKDRNKQAPSPATPPSPPPPPPEKSYTVACHACGTRVEGFEKDLGRFQRCPDCGSSVRMPDTLPPEARRPAVPPVPIEEDPAPYQVGPEESTRTVQEMHRKPVDVSRATLAKAKDQEKQKAEEQLEIPANPLVTGSFSFLLDPIAIGWLSALTILFSIFWVSAEIAGQSYEEGTASGMFVFFLLTVVSIVGFIIWAIVMGTCCTGIVQDSAYGHRKVADWPTAAVTEWIPSALYVFVALFYASLPGLLFLTFFSCGGLSWLGFPLIAISAFFLFPYFQLTLFEQASLTSPYSHSILVSFRKNRAVLTQFYLIAFVLAAICGVTVLLIWTFANVVLSVIIAAVINLCIFMYFRNLGRLALWLQRLSTD